MLGVTMVTDVTVILLFAACAELADALLEADAASAADAAHQCAFFALRVLSEFLLSGLHGLSLAALVSLVLLLPRRIRALRRVLLMLVAGYAFAAQPLLYLCMRELGFVWTPRIEPMLSCIIAGFIVCNPLGQRRQLASLLDASMPPVLCFFFFTTGAGMHLGVLLHTWPLTCGLFAVRLVALAVGSYIGCVLVGAPAHYRTYGWLAYVTQAGMSLGLAGEIAEAFPSWGPKLEMTLVSVIVLNQLVGPPLLEFALRSAGEDGCGAMSGEVDEERQLSPSSADAAERLSLGGALSVANFDVDATSSPNINLRRSGSESFDATDGSDGSRAADGTLRESNVSARVALISRGILTPG